MIKNKIDKDKILYILGLSKVKVSGNKKIVITKRFKVYVPTYDNNWIELIKFDKLKTWRVQGNPVSINPLINSMTENISENNKIDFKFLLNFKIKINSVANP